jgi:amino acid adenylation domain-containing protein
VEDLRPPRDLSRTPLFQVLFNMLELGAAAGLSLPMLQVGPFDALPSTGLQAKFDLTLYVHDEREGLGLTIVYNADLFDPQRIEELLDQYVGLLEAVSLDAALPLAEQSLVTRHGAQLLPDPAQSLQYSWNGSVMARVLHHAKSGPDRLAVQDRDVALSYADLQSLSSRLARHLVAQGVASGDRVAIHAERNAGLVWAMLGVLQAGAAFVVLDSAYPPERLVASLRIAAPKAFIDVSEAGPADGLDAQLAATPGLVRVAWGAAAEPVMRAWRAAPEAALEDSTGPRDLAYLVFTSGSTGVPKAVAGEHAPLSHFFQWHQDTWGLGPEDRFGVLSGLAHDPLLRDVLAALWAGAAVVMPDPDMLTAPAELLHWLGREAVSVVHLTPSMADLLGIGEEGGSAAPLPALRHAFFGGDQLRGSTVATMRRLAPNAQLVNFYGASETPQAMAFHKIDAAHVVPSAARVPVGRGIADAHLLVLTPSRRLAGIGELGEIAIRTPYLARGYFGDAVLTAERFIANPATDIDGDRLYLTGDLGRYRPDGSVDLAGRRDGQVKIRGFRIEIGEVEAALASHPSVRRAVVLCREAAPADPRLVAYVLYDPGNDLTVSDVRRYLRGKLPEYMIPSVVVTVEAIPLTPNGKLDRAALPDPFLQARVAAADPEPLRPGLEQDMAAIWRELLQVSSAGPLDNFFDLGGHSLLSLRVVATIERKLGLRIDPRSLFFLNLRQIVALIEAERPAVRQRLET